MNDESLITCEITLRVCSETHSLEELIALIGLEPDWQRSHNCGVTSDGRHVPSTARWVPATRQPEADRAMFPLSEQWQSLKPMADIVGAKVAPHSPEIKAIIDFVIYSGQYVAYYDLPDWFIADCGRAGLSIRLTVYPCWDPLGDDSDDE